jgi:hypothetical protein
MTDDYPESKIPSGAYCYAPTGRTVTKEYIYDENGQKQKTQPYQMPEVEYCPYFSIKDGIAYCSYLKSSEGLLFDSVKECGIRDGVDEDLEDYINKQESEVIIVHPG